MARSSRSLRNIIAGAVVALTPVLAAAQRGATPPIKTTQITGAFAPMRLVPTVRIEESDINAKLIVDLAVSPTGMIIIDDDGKQLIAFTAAGKRSHLIGRVGQGPGEYSPSQQSLAMGWLNDTLILRDARLRRVTLYAGATGRYLKSFPWTAPGWFTSILTVGQKAFAQTETSTGPKVKIFDTGVGPAPSEFGLLPITAAGLGAPLSGLADSVARTVGLECLDTEKSIHILDPFFPDHGSRRAVTSTGALVTADPDSFVLVVRRGTATPRERIVSRTVPRIQITTALWDSVAKEYLEVARTQKIVQCHPTMSRPVNAPVIRAIAINEKDQVWVETTARSGSTMQLLSLDGKAIGSFTLPPHDESVPWVIRNGKLYLVLKDADELQSIQVYDVRP